MRSLDDGGSSAGFDDLFCFGIPPPSEIFESPAGVKFGGETGGRGGSTVAG